MDISTLRRFYREEKLTPTALIEELYSRLPLDRPGPVWISLVSRQDALERARLVELSGPSKQLLYGIPFAVKDNIDVAGMRTTAACPAFAYQAEVTATVVRKLLAAGAILIGKTNLDQFATGLTGTRTPYGVCSSVFNSDYISGGSSAGSAVAVAQGLVSFSLGTDTAGSGRVPAALNGILGMKPTPGLLSTAGIVPACRTLDCVSIFAETCADAALVFDVARGFDPDDIYSRDMQPTIYDFGSSHGFRFGVPAQDQLEFFGDDSSRDAYLATVSTLEAIGGKKLTIDLTPFRAAADLLYSGPWVAERLASIREFFEKQAAEINPVVQAVISTAKRYSAVDAFNAAYRLEALRRQTAATLDDVDFLLLPTVPRAYTHAEIAASPIDLNSNLGYYTNFVNLLDLAAVAVPAGLKAGGLPFGASLIGPAGTDFALLQISDWLHRALNVTIAASERLLAETPPLQAVAPAPTHLPLVVVGAHLSGQPLNTQLTERGAVFLESASTSPHYRLYALANTTPPKPGLVYDPGFSGPGIEVEIWDMPIENVGSFLALIPPPLAIGNIHLANGQTAKGFLCEGFALGAAEEITHFKGWRSYLHSRS